MSEEVHLPQVVEPTPLLLIRQALDAKIAPGDLKELFDLQVRYERRRAEEAYADAITAFQAECEPIRKNAVNPHSKKTYADYEGVMRAITPLLRKHRIVVTFDTADDGQKMLTSCRVRVGVVEKVTTISLPVDAASKMMNATQAGGAAMSYGRRYALAAALNLVYTDEDTDARPADPGTVRKDQEDRLAALLKEAGMTSQESVDRFLDFAEKKQGGTVDSLAKINAALLPELYTLLNRKVAARRQAEAAKKAGGA